MSSAGHEREPRAAMLDLVGLRPTTRVYVKVHALFKRVRDGASRLVVFFRIESRSSKGVSTAAGHPFGSGAVALYQDEGIAQQLLNAFPP